MYDTAIKILNDIGFSNKQIEIIDKFMRLKKCSDYFSNVVVEYSIVTSYGRPMLIIGENHNINVSVQINKELKTQEHSKIKEMIISNLDQVGIDSKNLFSYCEKSFGLDQYGINTHFGFNNV